MLIPDKGKCTPTKACDDNNPCTHTDTCDSSGACNGTKYSCSDSLTCTTDTCTGKAGAGGCTYPIKAGFCIISSPSPACIPKGNWKTSAYA